MKKLILFLVASFIALSLASAYPVNMQLNGNINFNTAIYHCTDSSCNTLDPLYTSSSGNPISYTINNLGAGTQYFAEYDYTTDRCYVSHSYKNWFDNSTDNGPWNYNLNFQKQSNCQSIINSLIFNPNIYDNETQQITATLRSPLNLNVAGPQTVPNTLQYYYSTNVSAILEIRNQTSLIYSQTITQDISWSNTRNFVFNLPLLSIGVYSLTLKTNVNDCMCNNYIEQSQTGTFTVLNSSGQQNQTNQPPIANFTYVPARPNVTQTVSFDASSSYDIDGTIILYSWNFGDGNFASGVTTSHSYTATGNYSVTLTVTDNNNSQSSVTKIVEVRNGMPNNNTNSTNQPPIANFVYTPQLPIRNQTINFNASLSYDPDGSIISYSWSFDDGTIASGINVQHAFITAGNHSATLTVTDNGSAQSTITRIIQVLINASNQTNLLPFADFSYDPANPIINQVVIFNGSLSYDPDGIITRYEWNFGDGNTALGMIVQHAFNTPGNYPVSLTVTDNSSAQYTQSVVIRIVPVSQNQSNNTNPSTEPCDKPASKYGEIDSIAIREFGIKNAYCKENSELSFEVYNQQSGKMRDVKVTVEIPELNIKEESQFFSLIKFESEWLTFNLNLPSVQGKYYAKITVESQNKKNYFIKNIEITCPSAQPVIINGQSSDSSSSDKTGAGSRITGNVIAITTGNIAAAKIFAVFFILVVIVFIARYIFIRKQ